MKRISANHDSDGVLVLLGNAVRNRRKELKISQEELAALAGIERAHMGRIERGERNVTILNVIKIANAFKCRPSELLADADL
ncbi:helix-turn-helix domain-containing protein [Thorsellia anophelis]|uniref:Helix-turn-helix n=1 Tax=Thorsellia anophelis DSM 18579 TaxID=1123402 RepID=A0A1I0CW99_9GAMM|nr:helix-turn-helix transcriptional regulator [Thorsellia anophelis]SET24027.1 Helix-turn-helix [Thorsellia anophelis DSM 18579]